MSNQPTASAPDSDVKHWVHQIVTSLDAHGDGLGEIRFAELLDDSCADGHEVVNYSVAFKDGKPFYSALLRIRADDEEHQFIELRRIQRAEEEVPTPR